jgi:glycosyltransferase involved in cell wall biosynthesis
LLKRLLLNLFDRQSKRFKMRPKKMQAIHPRPIMLVSGNVRPVPGDAPVGGAARQAVKLSQSLRARGVDTHIITHRPRLRFPRHEVVDGVPVQYINSLYWLLYHKGMRRLEAMVRLGAVLAYLVRQRQSYDVIHIHTAATVTALAGVLAGRWLNKSTVLKITNSGTRNDFHRFRDGSGLPAARQLADVLRSATCVVTLNASAADELLSEGFDFGQLVHIPNGVDVDRFPPKSCYEAGTCANLTYVGRLYPSKGLNVLLEALAQLPPAPNWRLTLVGGGSARAQLAQQAGELGLEDRIEFVGEVPDVLPYLQQADLFVLPSHTEGISNALLEAMAAGLPCLATDNAGNRHVLTQNETGLLVRVGDAADMASALSTLLADAQLRERLGRAARHLVETCFSIVSVTEAYLQLYRELITGVT